MTHETNIPLRQIGAEIALRSTLIAFSRAMWDLRTLGAQELPPGPCFIYGNHSNNYDPFILNAFTGLGQGTAGVMTMEYLERGLTAAIFRSAGIEGTRKRVPEPHLVRRIAKLLENGRRIVIFPEGGRRWDGRPAPWIESTAKVFQRMGVPVYPVRIHGSYLSWPRWARWPRPASVGVEVCPPVPLTRSMSLPDVLCALRAPIAADENLVDPSFAPPWAFRPADGLERLVYRDLATGTFNGLRVEKGNRIVSEDGITTWRVGADSCLETAQHARMTSAHAYDAVRAMPLLPAPDGTLIEHMAWVQGEAVTVRLSATHAAIGDLIVPLEDIRFMGLERSDRLWLIGKDMHVYCTFPDGCSVLAWYDTLARLAPHINS